MSQTEYNNAIQSFGKHISDTVNETELYIAPGESATYMIKQMQTLGINLPYIMLLSHDQSWALSTRTRTAMEELVRQQQGSDQLTRLHLLDDFAITGEKLKRIYEVTQKLMGIHTRISILVAHTNAISLPNTTYIHRRDDNLASSLKVQWHRR